MKILISTFLILILCTPASLAQNEIPVTQDPVQLTAEERVDTLVKHVRKAFYSNDFATTIQIGEETLKLARRIEDRPSILRVSSLLGNAFLQINDTTQAKRIFFRSIQEAEKRNDTTRSLTTARIDLGNFYAMQDGKEMLAISVYKEAIPLAQKLSDSTHLFVLNYNLSELYLDLGVLEQSKKHVEQTSIFSKVVTAKVYKSVARLVEGRLSIMEGDPEKALKDLDKSIQFATAAGYSDALIEAYDASAKAHSSLGDYESATKLLFASDSLKAEKYKADKFNAVESVTAKFKLNQYQQDLKTAKVKSRFEQEQTKRETKLFWIKIAGGILILFSVFLLISHFNRKKLLKSLKKKNAQILEAKEISEEQIKAKNLLFSNITHELRTPMYGIVGISNILNEETKLEHQKEHINSLKFSAQYLLSLINNVLQYTQQKDSIQPIRSIKFDLRTLIHKEINAAEFLNTTNPNTFNTHIDPSIPDLLLGDDMKLSQIISNLLSNASKFTENGHITIEVEREADKNGKICLLFYIQDTGTGITKEAQKEIFKEFTTGDPNFDGQGTGLGLSIVKKLLDLFNSELVVESEINKGTQVSFELTFEEVKTNGIVEKPFENYMPASMALMDKNILVVDDNKINVLVTKKTLEKQGAKVVTAYNGTEGLRAAKEENLDLILMDINMPGMNGYEVTEAIRMFEPETPIIALTAVEEDKIIASGKKDVFTDFVIKPYKEEVFIELLSNYVSVEV